MLQELDGKIIQLDGTLLGFESLNQFTIRTIEGNPLFALLQSEEEEGVGLVVASPFNFFKEFTFEIPEQEKEQLQLEQHEDALVLGILTLRNPFKSSTMNLMAPIVVNIANMRGMQLVLPPKYDYSARTPISEKIAAEGGGQ
ncbi:flagellar assembly protein FliW [Paenibacillus terrigena]|uniref:flagellar assembly protein FliW n=1 Tax=Paenibacillus terrigena TaxID=369333 RepID=UPI0003664A84|nr:flagellar assembly protein FliW [Paenibacillus terrigena]